MKKACKILCFSLLGIIVILYLAFLFVLPNVVDINKFKPDVQKIVKEQANLNLEFDNAKIVTTPLLGAGVKIDNVSIKLPDDSMLFSADSIQTRIAIPSMLLLTVKVSAFEVENPFVNLEIANNKQFKVISLVEDLLNEGKEQKLENKEEPVEVAQSWFNPSWIRIKVSNVKLKNYKVLVNDMQSKHYLKLVGEELKAGYFNGKTAKVKTYAELFSDENKNITANINIDTFLPPPAQGLDSEDDPAERIEIPFVNPVTMYRNYDLKVGLDTKLKVRNGKNGIRSYGYFNIDGLTLNISDIKLPESYLHAKTFGSNITLDSNIYVTQHDNMNLSGKLNYGKNPKMDMNVKTSEIDFNDILLLGRAFLDSLHINNELANYKATGTISADCHIKTNFKKLASSGSVIIKDGGVIVKNVGNVISKANVNILLDDNVLNISDSHLLVDKSKVDIDGKIDDKSFADININANKVPLPKLFYSFAPKETRNLYNFRSADATLQANIKGKLKEAVASVNVGLDNLNLADKAANFVVKDKKFIAEFFANRKEYGGRIANDEFSIMLPKTNSVLSVPKFETEIAAHNIVIKENQLKINDKSYISYSGFVKNIEKLEDIKIESNGAISTDDMIKLIGKELKPFIHTSGSIPVKLNFEGNKNKQTLFVQALADKNNFITPVDFNELQGVNSAVQSVVDFKGNRIKIKKTGVFKRNISTDENGNEMINLDEIIGVDGTIAGDRINLIKITMPAELNGKIYVFPNSKFGFDCNAYVFGQTNSPRFRGGFNINNLSIPELLMDLRNVNVKLRSQDLNFKVADLLLNGSDVQVDGDISLIPSAIIQIPMLNVSSRYMNLDKVMVVSDKAMKYVPASPQSSNSAKSAHAADIPVVIKQGTINFARIITGNIDVKNTTADISLLKNIFYLNNIHTNVFNGSVNGDISMNLLTSLLKIGLKGENVNVDKAMTDAANMKGMLSGSASFETDITFKGASSYEEQMKNLEGTVNFKVKDGQFGPFGKLENMIIAENIRESAFFQNFLGGIVEGLFTIDTTHFSELNGTIDFKDGICHIEPLTSLGNILSLHVFGDFDLLKNYADMKVRARMASLVSNVLGPIGAISPANILNSATSLNPVTAKAFSIFCEMVPEEELAILPSFSNKYVDNAATKFQIVVRGDVAKPLKLVKSFKWLASKNEYDAAVDYVNSIPEPIEGSTATTVEEIMAERRALEAEKETMSYKVKSVISKDWANSSAAKEALKEVAKSEE